MVIVSGPVVREDSQLLRLRSLSVAGVANRASIFTSVVIVVQALHSETTKGDLAMPSVHSHVVRFLLLRGSEGGLDVAPAVPPIDAELK